MKWGGLGREDQRLHDLSRASDRAITRSSVEMAAIARPCRKGASHVEQPLILIGVAAIFEFKPLKQIDFDGAKRAFRDGQLPLDEGPDGY